MNGLNGTNGTNGAKGETGAKGEAGPPATSLWAVVETSGTLARGGTGTVSAATLFENRYEVVFNRDVTKCAYIATLGEESGGVPPAGSVVVAPREGNPNAVFVATYNGKGEEAAEPFHMAVFC